MSEGAAPDWRPVAVVTGAGSGIGRATVRLLLGRGGSVVAVDRVSEAAGYDITNLFAWLNEQC